MHGYLHKRWNLVTLKNRISAVLQERIFLNYESDFIEKITGTQGKVQTHKKKKELLISHCSIY